MSEIRFTKSQRELVVALLRAGTGLGKVARMSVELNSAPNTVRARLKRLYRMTGTHSMQELLDFEFELYDDRIRAVREAAWDEGYEAGGQWVDEADNPYRKAI